MHEDRIIRIGDLGAATGEPPAKGEACKVGSETGCGGTTDVGATGSREDGRSCRGVWEAAEPNGGSCILKRERGGGVAISKVRAAQSQLFEREP